MRVIARLRWHIEVCPGPMAEVIQNSYFGTANLKDLLLKFNQEPKWLGVKTGSEKFMEK